jgi:hypothetical protein
MNVSQLVEYQRTPAFAVDATASSVSLLNEIHSEIQSTKPQED